MHKRARVVHLVLFLGALYGLNYHLTKSAAIPSGDQSIWIHGGLLMLLLAEFWAETFFTRPADVVINGLAVFISVSTLSQPPYEQWWNLLRHIALILTIVAFYVVWAGSPAIAGNDTPRFRRFLYQVATRFGSGKVLFSFVFVLALISYFDLRTTDTKLLLAFWAVLLSAKTLDVSTFLEFLADLKKHTTAIPIGELVRFSEPNIVRFTLGRDKKCPRGSFVTFTDGRRIDANAPVAVCIGQRSTPKQVEVEAILVDKAFADGQLDNRRIVIQVLPTTTLTPNGTMGALAARATRLVGFAARDSDISRLFFEMVHEARIEEGNLVEIRANGVDVYYQVINGRLKQEATLDGGERAFVVVEAEQIGTWNPSRQGFSSHNWVAPENAPVVSVTAGNIVPTQIEVPPATIGSVPHTAIPVNIDLADMVLHHVAILGVTGTGKSYLACDLIERTAATGTKVVCLDITGDYQRCLSNAVLLNRPGSLRAFLDDTDARIGIVEFVDKMHPIKAAHATAQAVMKWCEENRTDEELHRPIAKVLMVLEEAHSLIPEWNANPTRDLQDVVVSTAQIVLQARKFGLGFMIITQRTANVTKSILNQCNTIFAFQAFDETGFEFMKNYMGAHYVSVLPNLRRQQGVLVGKASRSDRPIIVQFANQSPRGGCVTPEYRATSVKAGEVTYLSSVELTDRVEQAKDLS